MQILPYLLPQKTIAMFGCCCLRNTVSESAERLLLIV
jgi:hypothetical protein